MLKPLHPPALSDQDQQVFDALVPDDHYLRQVLRVVDFERYRDTMAGRYHPTEGRPAADPVLLLKLGFLQTQYRLSDREVCTQAQVNVAFRLFLQLGLTAPLPHPSLLTVFRARLGEKMYEQIFDGVVAQARTAGLVKDRLRLKDATHIIANIAIPSTIRLVAQTRQCLLDAAEPFAPERVAAERAHALAIRTATSDLSDEERLLQRVAQLRQIVDWADQVSESLGPLPEPTPTDRRAFADALALAHKILADRADSAGGDHVVSIHDPDARRGMHGGYFTGYLLDVAMDADSQIITALEVLPANGDEAADTTALIRHEETVHGNDVQTLSIDKAGFRGELLREWHDPEGLNLEVVVPPVREKPTSYFTAEDFRHDAEQGTLTCPGEQTTTRRIRNHVDTGWKYSFRRSACAACPLFDHCLGRLPKATGRQVVINDYAAEYAAAREFATSEPYRQIRREHPAIERKLADVVRRHAGRWARYRGRARVRIQYLLTGLVVNVKRMVQLLGTPAPSRAAPNDLYPVSA
jgi:transposase